MPNQNLNSTKKAPARAKATTKSNSGSRNGKGTKMATRSRKRPATESESEAKDGSQSEDEPAVKTPSRKKARLAARVAKRNNESDIEAEEVDVSDRNPEPEIISGDELGNAAEENEVSF